MKTPILFLHGALMALAIGSAFASSKLLPQFPATNGAVGVITVDAAHNRLYIGGTFTTVNGVARKGVAALSLSTGALLSWNPGVEGGAIGAIAVSPETGVVYLGGNFNKVGGLTRTRLAAVGANGVTVANWDPVANNFVYALAVETNTLYVGGIFTAIGISPVNRLVALNASNGQLQGAFLPNPDAAVNCLISDGATVYAGGAFTTIGGGSRRGLAALNANGGAVVAGFTADIDSGAVYTMALKNGVLYAGGNLSSVNGTSRFATAAVSATTGFVQAWEAFPNASIFAMAAGGANIYLGGSGLSLVGGAPRTRIAAVDNSSGAVTDWSPVLDAGVFVLTVHGSTVFVGGGFTTVNGTAHQGFAAINDSNLGPPLPPPAVIKPTIRNVTKLKVTTPKAKTTLRGTAKDATKVQFRTGKGGYRSAKGSAAKWNVPVRLKAGKTVVYVRAEGAGGKSKTLKFTIRRTK